MQIGSFRFAPPWWASLIALALVAALCALGHWQIGRAHYKERLIAAQRAAQASGPQSLQPSPGQVRAGTGAGSYGRRSFASGRYDDAHQILLADQVEGVETGYRVWTPLVLDSGVRIMVDRGWIPRSDDRNGPLPNPPAPAARVTVRGRWQAFPRPGLQFGLQRRCDLSGWPRALNYPDAAGVRCQYEAPVADGLLSLDPAEAGGFRRDPPDDPIGLRPWAHYLYAVQWFGMALAVLGIFAWLNTRRMRPE